MLLGVCAICTYISTYVCSTLTVCTRSVIPYVPIFLDAARRFYQSILETNALKDKGKYDFKVTSNDERIGFPGYDFLLCNLKFNVHVVPFFYSE